MKRGSSSQSLLIQRSYSYIVVVDKTLFYNVSQSLLIQRSYSYRVEDWLARGEEGSQSLLIQRSYSYYEGPRFKKPQRWVAIPSYSEVLFLLNSHYYSQTTSIQSQSLLIQRSYSYKS